MNFRYKLMQFMSGRYGIDTLGYYIFGTAAVLAFVNLFLRSRILQIIVYLIVIYAFFRILSRNTAARSRENRFFREKISFISSKKEVWRMRKNDTLHVYRKCPKCKAVLRLPHKTGTHTTVCPKCEHKFKVHVRK